MDADIECYTQPQFPHMGVLRSIVAALLLYLPATLAAQGWNQPARAFIEQLMAKSGNPSAITFEFTNNSSLDAAQSNAVRQALMAELRARNVRVVESAQAIADIKVTLSENARGYLWIADIRQGQQQDLVMYSSGRPGVMPPVQERAGMVLRDRVLYGQSGPILDFALLDDDELMVLDPLNISLYGLEQGAWVLRQSRALPSPRFTPRDLRGRLMPRGGSAFEAFLPGMKCAGAASRAITFRCDPTDDPWPLSARAQAGVDAFYNGSRNFFNGTLVTGPRETLNVPPFYSAALLGEGDHPTGVFAGVDGKARVFTDDDQPSLTINDWGGGIAGVRSGCGGKWQVVATFAADWTQPDSLQAFEISETGATAVSAPLALAGPVLAVWPTSDADAAKTVIRNLQTGNYEAHLITIDCGR